MLGIRVILYILFWHTAIVFPLQLLTAILCLETGPYTLGTDQISCCGKSCPFTLSLCLLESKAEVLLAAVVKEKSGHGCHERMV